MKPEPLKHKRVINTARTGEKYATYYEEDIMSAVNLLKIVTREKKGKITEEEINKIFYDPTKNQ